MALGRPVSFVDLHGALTAADLSSDGVHPAQPGYDKMAATWLPAITSVISPLGTADPPAVVRAMPSNLEHVAVTFSKPVDDSAASLDHFSLNNGATILQAALDPESKRVITLTTSPLAEYVTYTLGVSGVRDRTPLQLETAPGSSVAFTTMGLANGSFESGAFTAAVPEVPFDHYQLDGWAVTGNPAGFQQVLPAAPATDGLRMAIFNGGLDTFGGTISQDFTTLPGVTYQLEFDAGIVAAPGVGPRQQRLGVTVGGGALLTRDVLLTATVGGATQWTALAYAFTATGTTSTLTFTDQSGTLPAPAANDSDLMLDHVRVVASAPANTAPVANDDSFAATMDTPLVVAAPGVLGGDTDGQADPLTAVWVAGPAHGGLSLNPDGGFTYTPASGFTGTDTFSYKANDGFLDSNVATVTIVVTVPVLANGSFESGAFAAAVPEVPFDHYQLDGWAVTGNPAGFQQVLPAAPATDGLRMAIFNGGLDTFGGTISQDFTTLPGVTYQLEFDAGIVAAPGVGPRQQRLGVTVGGGALLTRDVLLTATGGGATQWTALAYAFTATGTTSSLTFTDQSGTLPAPAANDSDLMLDHVRVVASAPANTAPVANDDSFAATMDTPLVVAAPGVLGGDTDGQADPLTAVWVAGPAHGSLSLNPDGGFTYTPASGYTGTDTFSYKTNDGFLDSNVATVTLVVTAPPAPEIELEQPAGVSLATGSVRSSTRCLSAQAPVSLSPSGTPAPPI